MLGLPGQPLDVWQRDLATAAAIAPDGIDLYGLNLIPGTPLFTAIQGGSLQPRPAWPTSDDITASAAIS